jgi:3-phenylpropionate/cinnamic acid dioxygenase small subunit
MSTTQPPRQKALGFGDPLHQGACRFLMEEAQALDDRDFDAWLSMMSPQICYQVRVSPTTGRSGTGGRPASAVHFDEDLYSLQMRIDRLRTSFAWAEDPPSRTRRVVTNVCTYPTDVSGVIAVRSYIMLFRSRGDLREPDLLCGERRDQLTCGADGIFLLLARDVVLDESVLRTQNLAVFL